MPIRSRLILVFSTGAACVTSATGFAQESSRIVGYYAAWNVYGRGYPVASIPAERLTHINYAFAKVVDGECALADPWADVEKPYPGDDSREPVHGSFNQLRLLKSRNPNLRTLISVGGWTLSGGFSDAALTEASRTRFARSCAVFASKYGFDGVDIDWEFPVVGGLPGNTKRPEDRKNFTALLSALRGELDSRGAVDGRRYLLTIAASASSWVFTNTEISKIHEHLDWINLMCYDFAGPWSSRTGFNAPLFTSSADSPETAKLNCDDAVKAYAAAQVPRQKIVLGVPFYGRGWSGVPSALDGLYQPFTGQAQGSSGEGVFSYSDLARRFVGVLPRHWHEEARVPWLYDSAKQTMISYDDPESLGEKAAYVRKEGLGGVMIWELSDDDDAHALLESLRKGLVDPASTKFRRGDCNGDDAINLSDAIFLLGYNFTGGPSPPCLAACDVNADGEVAGQVTDAVYLLSFAFLGGPPPAAPYFECDSAGTGLECNTLAKGCR